VEIIAHRGVHKNKGEENTIGAFNRALFLKCEMLELDCCLTNDRKLVVSHDLYFTLNDNTRVYIQQNTLKDLHSKVGAVIPLEFVLKVFMGAIKINVELKDRGCAVALHKLLEKLTAERNWSTEFLKKNLIVSSFVLDEAVAFKILYPHIETAWIVNWRQFLLTTKGAIQENLSYFCLDAIHLHRISVSRKVVFYFKAKGFKVRVYTVNNQDLMKKCLKWGVDGIFTDKPGEFLKA